MWGRDSLSGKERNRLFLNHGGTAFSDISLVSGADHLADGRSVCVLDFDRDGHQDLAVINVNSPKLLLYRNEKPAPEHHWIKIRLVGSNQRAQASPTASNRNGYGAFLRYQLGSKTLAHEHRCGEGFSAQNSSLIHLGLGSAEKIDHLQIRWPSGKTQSWENLAADQVHLLREE